MRAKEAQYPGRVVHLRRAKGGQGKAHTLNHGLAVVLGDDWMEALLITDADVIFEPAALRTMTRHLADPAVGAVTCYIKEGSRPGNYLTRFIGYEYITAQAAARRGQNVLGAVACLAGGAQLHSRANLLALGGRIDTTSLAEDTFTTFETQLRGRRVVFEPHAICWAEEPDAHRGPVEAAAPLGPRQRPGHHPLPQALVPAKPHAPPRQRAVRALLVLPLPPAGLHDHVVGGPAHPVLHRRIARLVGVPRALDHQRRSPTSSSPASRCSSTRPRHGAPGARPWCSPAW